MKITNINFKYPKINFNYPSFKAHNKISNPIDTIEIKSKEQKKIISDNITQLTGIKKDKAEKMVEKYYNSDSYRQITDENFHDFVNDALKRPLTQEEAIIYLKYNLDAYYEMYFDTYLENVSPLELPKYLDKGLNIAQAATLIKSELNAKQIKKYTKTAEVVNSANYVHARDERFNNFLVNLSKNTTQYDTLTSKNIKKSGLIKPLTPKEAIDFLYRIDCDMEYNDEFSLSDKKEIINHYLWKKQDNKNTYFEDSIELIRENKNSNAKNPEYIIYILNFKHKVNMKNAKMLAKSEACAQNLNKILSLIKKDSKGKSKAGTYRILSPKEALLVVQNGLNKKQTEKVLEFIDYKGLEIEEAIEKVLNS